MLNPALVIPIATLPPFNLNELGWAAPGSTNFFSIHRLITKALPVIRWQSRQWQA